jgi:small subunit ribosomal protein S6e
MPFKINISTKDGKTFKLEAEAPALKQHKLGDTIKGEEISPDLAGYELEITGTSDFAGFTSIKSAEGIGLQKKLLTYGKAMHKRSKGDKKKPRSLPGGLKLRKTVRGAIISDAIIQVNTKVVKQGSKKLSEVFPDQNKTPEAEEKKEESKPSETPAQEKAEEPKKQEQAPNEAAPEQEPKESEASEQEKANPDKEPK